MNEFLTPEKMGLFLMFSVPGIIILYFRAQFITGRLSPIAEGAVSYLTLSLIYQAVSYPITSTYLFGIGPMTLCRWVGWFAFIFAVPAVVGVLLGLNLRKGWLKVLINKFGISTIHPVNCAWDWHFGQCGECWVAVVLKDGTKWYGFMGRNSFMSSDPAERDLYIESVYVVENEGDPWTPRGNSVWIAHGEIQSLEFLPNHRNEE